MNAKWKKASDEQIIEKQKKDWATEKGDPKAIRDLCERMLSKSVDEYRDFLLNRQPLTY